jgi:LysR family glycine cleavage system transcriptional activator
VEAALQQLDDGLRAATRVAADPGTQIRLTLTPSFAQRWLLPRMTRWRAQHPDLAIEIHATPQLVDLARDGYHVALRQGVGTWRGLKAERLIDSPLVALASPAAAQRLAAAPPQALADEPLLGDGDTWQRWFALHGLPGRSFNDAGHLLQAVERIGIGLARELLAADALRDGRLVRLSEHTLQDDSAQAYWLVYPPEHADWPPLQALRDWLRQELRASARSLRGASQRPAGTAAAVESRSRARRSAFSMNSNGSSRGAHLVFVGHRLPGQRMAHVGRRLAPAHLAHDAVGKDSLPCAPGADAQVVAELPVVQVVHAAVAGRAKAETS